MEKALLITQESDQSQKQGSHNEQMLLRHHPADSSGIKSLCTECSQQADDPVRGYEAFRIVQGYRHAKTTERNPGSRRVAGEIQAHENSVRKTIR